MPCPGAGGDDTLGHRLPALPILPQGMPTLTCRGSGCLGQRCGVLLPQFPHA